MKNRLIKDALLLFFSSIIAFTGFSQQDKITKGWEAFNNNKRAEALQLFKEATKDPSTEAQAYLGMCLVNYNETKPEETFKNFLSFYNASKNPYPYVYALWYTSVVNIGSDDAQAKEKLKFLEALTEDPKANATLKGMAWQSLGQYEEGKNNIKDAREYYQNIHALDQWTITGKFDNISASGFNKDFGPLQHPEANAVFKNYAGAKVGWIPVKYFRNDRWFDFTYHFYTDNSISYAQTFVNSPTDVDAILRTGVSGSIKVWVNDQLVISEDEERNTDIDVYNASIHLTKGYNRILVQVGSSEISASNFMVRLTDASGNLLPNITCTSAYQSYPKGGTMTTKRIPLFAEKYLEDQLKANDNNYADKYLLTEVYLHNEKSFKARKIMEDVRKDAPNSAFVSKLLIRIYDIDDNETGETKEEEFLKKVDPYCYKSIIQKWAEAINKEDYDEADKVFKQFDSLFGKTQVAYQMMITLDGKKNDVKKMVSDINQASSLYPNNSTFTTYNYLLKSQSSDNLRIADYVLEKYLKKNSSGRFESILINNYFKLGDRSSAERLMEKKMEEAPYSVGDFHSYAKTYFAKQDYKSALEWQQRAVELAPYIGSYYQLIGSSNEALGNKDKAVEAYKKCIYYDPTSYDARQKLRELTNQKELFSYISTFNLDSLYKAAPDSTAYPNDNSVVLLNDKQRVVYSGGASKEKVILVAKVFNQAGVDNWKHYSIGYNPYSQRLIVEKAQLLKPDGSKIKAEVSGGDIVFSSIEKGDAIVIIYKIENYNSGRLAQHFWDDFHFTYFIPVENSRYTLITPNSQKLDYKTLNTDIQPTIKTEDNWKIYTWQTPAQKAIEYQNYMPYLADASKRIEISSVKDWKFIQDWYSDLSSTKTKSDYEVKEVVNNLFEGKEGLTDLQKAKIIYHYIVKNISYSSVPFLQSAYTPQRAAKTLNTRLGDCKDLSTLFVSMAKEVGIKANLVLVETRDNGDNQMLLPSVNFNHCIATAKIDGKRYLIELTNPYLPFGALTWITRNASALFIPMNGQTDLPQGLVKLNSETDVKERIVRASTITLKDGNMEISRSNIRTGSMASEIRSNFTGKSHHDQMKTMSSIIADDYASNIKLNSLSFKNLDNLNDTVSYDLSFTVKNTVNEVAGMTIVRLPWTDRFSSMNFLTVQGDREFPFDIWKMDLGQLTKETITLNLPEGKRLVETPKDIHLSCPAASYDLTFKVLPKKLVITRVMQYKKGEVPTENFGTFKTFFTNVSKADRKQYAFK